MPVTAADAGECSHIVMAAIGVFRKDFLDTFLGGAFGAKDYFARGTAATEFGGKLVVGAFVVHKS